MTDSISKEYDIVYPSGANVKVKNWIKVAKENNIRVTSFKSLLDEDIIYCSGFYLKKNENIIPHQYKRIVTFDLDGEEFIVKNISEFSRQNNIPCTKLHKLCQGVSRKTKENVKIKKVEFIKTNPIQCIIRE